MQLIESLSNSIQQLQFTSKLKVRTLQKIIRFLENSVPLTQTLKILYTHATKDGKRLHSVEAKALDQWHQSVRDGKTFGDAIQGWIPESERLVIVGGEKAGNLTKAIEQSLTICKSISEIKKAIIGGLSYPIVLFVGLIAFLLLFSHEVIPEFEAIFPREHWTGAGAQMAMLSEFIQNWLFVVVIVWFICVGVCIYSFPRLIGPLRMKIEGFPTVVIISAGDWIRFLAHSCKYASSWNDYSECIINFATKS